MKKLFIPVIVASIAAFSVQNQANAEPIFAITTANELLRFESSTPGATTSIGTISGLAAGETIVGIDFRPATPGVLVGVGNLGGVGTVYQINTSTGAANPIRTGLTLTGTEFGVDFNPVPNALRIVSDANQNLRITAGGTGVINTDATLNPGDPNVVAAAYSNNVPGGVGGQTTLYVIDSVLNALLTQGTVNFPPGTSPNTGTLFNVGALGFDTSELVGFDISGARGAAFASLTPAGGGNSQLFTINLATGAASLVGTIGTGTTIRGIAIFVPEPASLALFAIGLAGVSIQVLRRRK